MAVYCNDWILSSNWRKSFPLCLYLISFLLTSFMRFPWTFHSKWNILMDLSCHQSWCIQHCSFYFFYLVIQKTNTIRFFGIVASHYYIIQVIVSLCILSTALEQTKHLIHSVIITGETQTWVGAAQTCKCLFFHFIITNGKRTNDTRQTKPPHHRFGKLKCAVCKSAKCAQKTQQDVTLI